MTWASDEAYLHGLDVMTKVVEQVPEDAWSQPSPCEGWRALDVLGHVGFATAMGVRILGGGDMTFEPTDPPGDVIEGDPRLWWSGVASQARAATEALDQADLEKTVDTPMGPRTIDDGIKFPGADLFLHAWDIAQATGVTVAIPDEAVPFIRALGDMVPEAAMRSPRVFGAEVTVPDGASDVDRLLGWTGRDPSWQPPTS